ncbi:hypothetical protein MKW14_04980 [Streptomyces sp. CME 23]|nr:hypothetical protein [Streptomyces sp. CME 23]
MRGAGTTVPATTVTGGATALGIDGSPLELRAELAPRTAARFGLDVRTGAGQRTRIGYDTSLLPSTEPYELTLTCEGTSRRGTGRCVSGSSVIPS